MGRAFRATTSLHVSNATLPTRQWLEAVDSVRCSRLIIIVDVYVPCEKVSTAAATFELGGFETWLTDWMTDWFIGYWLTDWLTDWLIDWLLIDWLLILPRCVIIDWLTDWLSDWPIFRRHTRWFVVSTRWRRFHSTTRSRRSAFGWAVELYLDQIWNVS